jgi:dimethylargininase
VVSLPAEPGLPDSVFVEDPAIVLDEIAVIARMGAAERRPEAESLAAALSHYRELRWMAAPATIEGGDVLCVGNTLYVGVSRRTNREGVEQLAGLVAPFGYSVTPVAVHGCLHLKTAITPLGDGVLLANRRLIDAGAFRDFQILDVSPDEPWAANALRVGDTVLLPSAFPRTREVVEKAGFQVRSLDISEFLKAEAGLTCMSLLLDGRASG